MSDAENAPAAPSNPKVEYINGLLTSNGETLSAERQPVFAKLVDQIKTHRQAPGALKQLEEQAQQLQTGLQDSNAAANVLVDLLWDAHNKT